MSETKTDSQLLEEIAANQKLTLKESKEASANATEAKSQIAGLETKWNEAQKELIKKDATILELQTESKKYGEKIKEIEAKAGRMKASVAQEKKEIWIGDKIAETMFEKKDAIMNIGLKDQGVYVIGTEPSNETERKASVIQSSSLSGTGNNYTTYLDWQPGMEPLGQDRFRQFVGTVMSETDFVRFPRANTPVGTGSFNRVDETSTKPQVDRGYTMIDLTLKPMAGYAIVSRQSLRNIIYLQSWLPTSMMEQLQDSEDADYSQLLVAAATGSSTTSFSVKAEKLVSYIVNLKKTKYVATDALVDDSVYTNVLLTKPNDYSLPNIVTVTSDGVVKIMGKPMTQVNWLTNGRVLVGDFRRVKIVQSEGLVLRQSDSHASIFTANEIAFLLERTEGLAVYRPDAFVTAIP